MTANSFAKLASSDDSTPPEKPSRFLGFAAPLLVGALTVGLTLWAWKVAQTAEYERINVAFASEVKHAEKTVKERLRSYEQVLLGGVALFEASEDVNRDEWRTYVDTLNLAERYPGIQGIGYSQVVAASDLEAHVREIRAQGFSGYRLWPEGERSEYTAIIYLEPFDERNKRAFGYDMFSQSMRREAMQRARDSGLASVSGRVILVQETDEDVQAGFLTYLPLYKKGMPTETVTQRREALQGYVYSPYRMDDLMRGILGNAGLDIALRIYDGTGTSADSLMYASENSQSDPVFRTQLTSHLSGRTWTLDITSQPYFEARLAEGRSNLIIAPGLAIALLLTALTWSMMNMRARAVAFANRMTSDLKHSERRFRTAIGYSAVGTALVAPDGTWIEVNRALLKFLGYTREELLAKKFQAITHPDDLDGDLELVSQILNRDIDNYRVEKRYLRKNGTYCWALLSVSMVWHDDGTPLHFISQIQDISDRKQRETEILDTNALLETRVRNRTAALEVANEELAAFAYSVSHDLRAPLRSIDGFSQALAEDYGDKLDDEGKDFIRRVREGSSRMEQLIDDMLALSRVNRTDIEMQEVDLSALAANVAARLTEADPDRDVTFAIAPGLTIQADPHQAEILLENLLGNSWKYSANCERACIELGTERGTDGETVYFIRDNGAGFDMAYADKLFKPFQRLHSDDEFKGTGIGLATVARVINRHGGQIWAEASEGAGATFFFTIPATLKQEAA